MTPAAWIFMVCIWSLIIGSMGWCFFKLLTLPASSSDLPGGCPVEPGKGDKP